MDERGMLSGTDRRLSLGIPFHKLSSNDGAHVLAEEISELTPIECLMAHPQRPPADFAARGRPRGLQPTLERVDLSG